MLTPWYSPFEFNVLGNIYGFIYFVNQANTANTFRVYQSNKGNGRFREEMGVFSFTFFIFVTVNMDQTYACK